MSPPATYGGHHLLNPWMAWHEEIDRRRAFNQWERLVEAVQDSGGRIELLPPSRESGAMTFTRDTAVVASPQRALVLRNVGRRGDIEPTSIASWLGTAGFSVEEASSPARMDGGNVIVTAEHWLVGMPPGVRREDLDPLADLLVERSGRRVYGIPLAATRFGHLDLSLADLAGKGWLMYPPALGGRDFEHPTWRRILGDQPLVIVDDEEAAALACNVVIVGDAVIGAGLSPRLCREVERLGLAPVPLELDEFRKAGGGAHCLTLDLLAPSEMRESVTVTEKL